ncbi:LOW QUALITY PROTEIN: putative receptor protein kinase ZmPK1 [Primulina eburnea]|uniref:LOW QUALITY PROTEIN: putative receptor protein kinase ZmPK1 n=1 Tax=Primulina eburnea TaxID=1245227 RepID=UPI003C6C19AC
MLKYGADIRLILRLFPSSIFTFRKMESPILESLCLPFLLFFLLFIHSATSRSHVSLERGDSLSVGKESDFITSPDNSFTCGFYGLGTNAYWLAIWFTNSRDKTVVWVANRDRPVNRKGSKVTFRRDGAMVLTDIDDTIVWQSNTTSTDVAAAQLLDSGNLVLTNPKGDILWQSFDSPTDTLLPYQRFTKTTKLTSLLRNGSYETGYFNLYFGSDNVLRLIYDSPDTSISYWPNPDNTIYTYGRTNYNGSRIAVLDDMGRFLSSDLLQFNASDIGYGVKRRLTMDYDGNLRVYSLVNSTGLWDVTWQALIEPCNVRGVCGRNAICVYAPEPKCVCPPGFKVVDPSDWNFGCKAMFDEGLLNSRMVKFLAIPHTDFYGYDLNATFPVTFEQCSQLCSEDFRCLGFSYRLLGQGYCYVKSALLNGYASPDFPASIYIKIPGKLQTKDLNIFHASSTTCESSDEVVLEGSPSMYDFANRRVKWVYIYSFAIAIGTIELIFVVLGWWFLFRKHGIPASVEAGYRMISSQFRCYRYSELKKATGNFKEELGRGGSGVVFKGVLSDERVVAVKRLGDVFQGQEEYWAEISTIGKINHMNLVRTLGFCSERRRRLLVYEYVENLSLDRHLFDSTFLGWKQRYAVALGTAKGLAYLHHECLEWVIHCDVKPENILLDAEFLPKIADFGLAKLTQRGGPGSEFTRIRGTKGYMAPEWALNHPITAKVDVFGYGVVILEMVRGIRLSNWIVEDEGGHENESTLANFARVTRKKIEIGSSSWIENIVDSRLEGKFSRKQAAILIQTGVRCVDEDRNKRPTMASVVQTLLESENEMEIQI